MSLADPLANPSPSPLSNILFHPNINNVHINFVDLLIWSLKCIINSDYDFFIIILIITIQFFPLPGSNMIHDFTCSRTLPWAFLPVPEPFYSSFFTCSWAFLFFFFYLFLSLLFYLFQNPSLSLTPTVAAAINIKSVILEAHLMMRKIMMMMMMMMMIIMGFLIWLHT